MGLQSPKLDNSKHILRKPILSISSLPWASHIVRPVQHLHMH